MKIEYTPSNIPESTTLIVYLRYSELKKVLAGRELAEQSGNIRVIIRPEEGRVGKFEPYGVGHST